jgi:hypothetical protein
MDEGKVLLVNLAPSDHLSAENARAFGALLVNEFFECALRRRNDSYGASPVPYYLYLDEFQKFVSLDIADMLDQVRKFGLFMVLAHQRFGQLDENLVDAILTNCSIKAVFGGLSAPNARRMAEELFIGELDAKRVKVSIYQTKFWPEYSRDKVYSKGSSHTATTASTHSTGSGIFAANASGVSFQPGDWFGPAGYMSTSDTSSSGNSDISGLSESSADAHGETQSEADIPILLPVPFEELSNIQYYTIEEQLVEVTAALKEQFQRHCFIKVLGEKTQPLLVPFVKAFYTPPTNRTWYEKQQTQRQGGLSSTEVDVIIAAQEQLLLEKADVADEPETIGTAREKSGLKRKTGVKSKAAKANPFDKVLQDIVGRE